MSLHFLGESIDIHTGGIDLRFPHHEDERAQSDAAAGQEVVRHWVHGEHLLFEGRKMAKSSGNVVLVEHLVERGLDPLALRLAFLTSRYRTQVDLSWAALVAADAQLTKWRDRVRTFAESPSRQMCSAYVEEVVSAFNDDLDTPKALQTLRRLDRDDEIPDGSKFEMFAHLDGVLGLDLVRDVGRSVPPVRLSAEAQTLVAERERARASRDWSDSDRLRDALAALGVTVTDTQEGQTVSVKRDP
jgi:cysteinyl-tRNA synthetase